MKTVAIILAAGSSNRFASHSPKQYHLCGNEVILNKTIKVFAESAKIDHILVVIAPEHKELYESKIIAQDKLLPHCFGGATRQESAFCGLNALREMAPKKVLIHDAARPYLDVDIIGKVVDKLDQYKAVDLEIPVVDTIKMKTEDGVLSLDRGSLYATQTPQGFDYASILSVHQESQGSHATDDVSLMLENGYKVGLVSGSSINQKITYQYELPKMMRIGNGFDVHKFAEQAGEHVITLGGIKIPHSHAIIAHSDGDVVFHALTDAILGSIAAGDIGDHFPPTEEKWRNLDSAIFLKHALGLLQQHGAVIANVDITIICQKPKISQYRAAIQRNIAGLLQLNSSQVSIKATTTEGLGFTGREEGIAVQAICLVTS